ncbi:hypothetical protein [Rhizobium giardinii]|uniref:hypothetical protein n=1 Tax=Rhizobium giardinii TaxID=56731 RepID=UPI003D6FE637
MSAKAPSRPIAPPSDRLTANQREAIRRMAVEGRSGPEISAILRLPLSSFESFAASNKKAWFGRTDAEFKVTPKKTILFRHVPGKDGSWAIRPYSVARISMHIAALVQRSHKREALAAGGPASNRSSASPNVCASVHPQCVRGPE